MLLELADWPRSFFMICLMEPNFLCPLFSGRGLPAGTRAAAQALPQEDPSRSPTQTAARVLSRERGREDRQAHGRGLLLRRREAGTDDRPEQGGRGEEHFEGVRPGGPETEPVAERPPSLCRTVGLCPENAGLRRAPHRATPVPGQNVLGGLKGARLDAGPRRSVNVSKHEICEEKNKTNKKPFVYSDVPRRGLPQLQVLLLSTGSQSVRFQFRQLKRSPQQ